MYKKLVRLDRKFVVFKEFLRSLYCILFEMAAENDDTFDPGTARFGNFMNYYSFNPAENRIKLLPNILQHVDKNELSSKIICLDIGCNSGELTQELHNYLSNIVGGVPECHIMGVDMDEILIHRANENNHNKLLTFKCVNVQEEHFKTVQDDYLQLFARKRFDIVFCFSITMWIHLNHGDEGLKAFISSICATTNMVVMEPQPWRCYTRAVRRMKRNNIDPFPFFDKLKIRRDIEDFIDNFLCIKCNFTKVLQSSPTKWGRVINVYKRNNS